MTRAEAEKLLRHCPDCKGKGTVKNYFSYGYNSAMWRDGLRLCDVCAWVREALRVPAVEIPASMQPKGKYGGYR